MHMNIVVLEFSCKIYETRNSPEGFISELSSVLLVNTDGGGLTGLYIVPLQANKLLLCFSPLLSSLFYQSGTPHQATSGSGSLILLVVSQQTSHRSLHAFLVPLSCSILPPGTLSHASSGSESLSPYTVGAGRFAMSMNNLKSPTNAMHAQPSYKLNCIVHTEGYGGWGKGLNKVHGQYRYLPVL